MREARQAPSHYRKCCGASEREHGFVLLPVVLLITLVAVVAFMLNHESALGTGITGSHAEADRAEYIARAGMAHAQWWTNNNGCQGDGTMTTVPLGQGSYTATVDAGGSTTTAYTFTPDRDTWIKEVSPDENNGGVSLLSVKIKPGDTFRALYHYDLSSIPNDKKVLKATAWFYVDQNDAQGSVTLHRVTTDWTETGATWNTIGSNFESGLYGTIPPQPVLGVWIPVNVTALAQAWVNDSATNYGILLNATVSDLESRFTSRESAASQRPYLQITTADTSVSPVTITATGTLDSGVTRTLTRTNVPAYQPPGYASLQLQPGSGKDAMLSDWYDTKNYGDYRIRVESSASSPRVSLVQFELAAVPAGARVLSAQLQLYHTITVAPGVDAGVSVHRVIRDWVEGTQGGSGTADGATWLTWDSTNAWTTAGGDYDPAPAANSPITDATGDWESWDISTLVQGWLDGSFANNGLLLKGTGTVAVSFASKEDADPALRPKLTITYACECGSPCLAPQGNGNVLMAVVNPTTLVPADATKKALFESWGYTVEIISESANQTTIDAAVVNNDVVYVSNSCNSNTLGNRLAGVPIGVMTEDGDYNSDLGFATGSGYAVGSAIDVTDTSHYITAVFPAGPLSIYDADMEGLTVGGTPAPELQSLANWGTNTGLGVLESGAATAGGGSSAGRRVMLPLGRNAGFNWDYLNANGQLLLHRALLWGMNAEGGIPPRNLLFVAGSTTPTAQDQLRIDLIESWGYAVTVIDDDDTHANYDTALADVDIAYIAGSGSSAAVGTKLTAATVGVLSEDIGLVDELGFAEPLFVKKNSQHINVIDDAHYVTSGFSLGALQLYSYVPEIWTVSGALAPGLQVLGETQDAGNTFPPGLAVLETGAELYGGGFAAGRRVQVPWAQGSFDFTALNADGQTIMQRALEWAQGAGAAAASESVLLVVADAGAPTQQELDRQTLIEGWGYTVNLISANDSQANFDTAVATASAAYVVMQDSSTALGTKLRDASIAVINEEVELRADIGFAANRDWPTTRDTVDIIDNSHYITSPFATGLLTIATGPIEVISLSGQMAGGLQALGQQDWGGPQNSLSIIDTGGDLYGGGTAAGRRVQLPWGRVGFDINALNANGLDIMQRAIEWGIAGGGGGGGGPPPAGPAFEEFTEASDGGATSLIIDKPAGTAAGDLLIAAVATDGNTVASLAPPAGWNVIHVGDQGGNVTFGVWWKLAGASEPGTYTFSWSGSEHVYGWIMRFTGHDPANPIDTSANAGGTSGAPSSPTVTTTVDDTLILRLGGFDDDDITTGDPGLTGHTAINMGDSGNGSATASGGSGYVLQPTAGASGTASFNLTGSEQYATVTLAIAPAP